MRTLFFDHSRDSIGYVRLLACFPERKNPSVLRKSPNAWFGSTVILLIGEVE